MHKEPFFKSDYFKKLTGSNGINDVDLPGVEKALSSFLWYILTKEALHAYKMRFSQAKITPQPEKVFMDGYGFEWSMQRESGMSCM